MSDRASSASVLQQFVLRARRLYSLPAVALKVLEVTQHPDASTQSLKECIETDPAMTATILRVVNSSLFGSPREVTDLNQALAMLGVKPLKLLVLGFSLPTGLLADLETEVLGRYWRHSLTKAVACRELSQRCWNQSGDEAFLAGLLQDIGLLALIQDLGEPYVRFIDQVHQEGGSLTELETDTLGFDHVILSARMLDHWGLPKSIVRAVAATHEPERLASLPPAERPLPQALHLAELLAQLLTCGRTDALPLLQDAGARFCGMTGDQLSEITDALEPKVQHLADALGAPLADQEEYLRILVQAHADLAAVAEDAAKAMAGGARPIAEEQADTLRDAVGQLSSGLLNGDDQPQGASGGQSSPQSPAGMLIADPGVSGRIRRAVNNCRRKRCAISLVLLEFDDYDTLVFSLGQDDSVRLMRQTCRVIDSLSDTALGCVPADDARFAVILENCDRSQGVDVARRLIDGIRRWFDAKGLAGEHAVTMSVGVATLSLPPRNFPSEELAAAAERCLSGARASGGDAVKSIMI